ncbi:helix-turn-helix transcriptional regulator [Bacillus sp. UMB0893]|uniref:helix-turn-helix transcriptional regulator n=1 Tax=Bacillus sp. UMB0893 TaxID=2066053 RepID=UPI000C76AD2A|nr:helix-turn-helix transcriptional regulator [Bacillus sp. UMB0893]PLR65989.1 transcriptional regulator [Bacillus sp. UMB0893]QNG60327.1 helix-turn-helix transcriptional regulator [Bacillus sp. PAMC26568]
MFGFGKQRSRLGKWLDKRGISQEWLMKKSKVSRNTISKLASGTNEYEPSLGTIKKLMSAIRQVDPGAKTDDFFDV